MSCPACETLLYPYLDGELVDDERLNVETHLASCPECARRFDSERHTLALIKARAREGSPVAPAALREAVFANVDRASQGAQRRRLLQLSAAAAGMALAATMGHQGWLAWQRRLDSDEAARRHARQFPLEVQGQPEAVEAWFGGKLDHRVNVPRFPNATTAGARLIHVRDRDAAYIRYQPLDERVVPRRAFGLFVYDDPSSAGAGETPVLSTSHGYTVVRWQEGDLVYQLVTDLDEGDARQFVPRPRYDVRPASLESPAPVR